MITLNVRRVGKLGLAALLSVAFLTTACKREEQPETTSTGGSDAVGQAALDDGDWSRAYDSFTKAIEADANDVDAYYGRAAASLARAQEHYNLAQAHATNQKIEEGKAEAAKADDFFKKAVADADAILKIDPKFADAWFIKGVVCQYQGMWDEGIEAFTECVKIDGERAEAYQRRGEIYDHICDYMNSSLDFKKASELGYTDDSTGTSATDSEEGHVDINDLNYEPDEPGEGAPSEEK